MAPQQRNADHGFQSNELSVPTKNRHIYSPCKMLDLQKHLQEKHWLAQLANDVIDDEEDHSSRNDVDVDSETEARKQSLVDHDVDNTPDDATPILHCGDSQEETSVDDQSTALSAFENWVDEWLDDFVVKYSVDFHVLG
mmetsp:Transcript_5026/g.10165  ORF Transcript_5026/g.10165 Transcript_5026/m.10165 type:complete len:139 (-) Transcript_5026:2-418(-)